MKPTYDIYKLRRPPQYWDGGYTSRKKALEVFKDCYKNPCGEPADFAIFKTTYTRIAVPKKKVTVRR